jgi:single-strand DNA-binding protein
MEDLNVVVLAGRATRDAELKYTPKGTAVATFALAVNRSRKGDDGATVEEASFFEVVAWERTAEVVGEYVKKGKAVTVVGGLKQDRWTAQDGSPRSKVVVNVGRLILGASPKQAEGGGAAAEEYPPGLA